MYKIAEVWNIHRNAQKCGEAGTVHARGRGLGWGAGDGPTEQIPSPSRVVWAQYYKSVDLNRG